MPPQSGRCAPCPAARSAGPQEAAEDAEALREILNYLESDPVFARSILMFVGDEEVICRAKEEEQDSGLYLDDLS